MLRKFWYLAYRQLTWWGWSEDQQQAENLVGAAENLSQNLKIFAQIFRILSVYYHLFRLT